MVIVTLKKMNFSFLCVKFILYYVMNRNTISGNIKYGNLKSQNILQSIISAMLKKHYMNKTKTFKKHPNIFCNDHN